MPVVMPDRAGCVGCDAGPLPDVMPDRAGLFLSIFERNAGPCRMFNLLSVRHGPAHVRHGLAHLRHGLAHLRHIGILSTLL